MLKTLTREITLSIQARNGASPAVMLWFGVIMLAMLAAFVFLCVAGYDWLALQFGSVLAGLIMAGVFVAIAILAAIVCALIRRRVRERAILARAARAHAPSWLLDPRLLSTAVEAGRSIGWQRIVPVALVGFMVAQWAREYKDQGKQHF
ncbi:MAG: hypothetical protein ABSE22_20535 [Xanthobacteraceae bacterium]|jgi:hypothetical protein